jgi:major type 1 subunit fimbrin (pilin)
VSVQSSHHVLQDKPEASGFFNLLNKGIPSMKNMIRTGVIASLVSASALLSAAAQAADGTISFTGSLTDTTCTVTAVGGTGGDLNVTLPTISATKLAAPGSTAGDTVFKLQVTGGATCADGTIVRAHFNPGATTDLINNVLNSTGTATHVAFELVNGDGTVMTIGGTDATSAVVTAGTATLAYVVRYKSILGAATAGTASSSVTYDLAYN